jgi:hypothetical protein
MAEAGDELGDRRRLDKPATQQSGEKPERDRREQHQCEQLEAVLRVPRRVEAEHDREDRERHSARPHNWCERPALRRGRRPPGPDEDREARDDDRHRRGGLYRIQRVGQAPVGLDHQQVARLFPSLFLEEQGGDLEDRDHEVARADNAPLGFRLKVAARKREH